MTKPADFGLQPNPFQILPTDDSIRCWAGMPEVRRTLEDVITSVQPDDIGGQEFVIIHSPLGGGKTHAFRFFKREIEEESKRGYAFFVGKVRLGPKPSFLGLFQSIIRENHAILPKLVRHVQDAITSKEKSTRKSGTTLTEPELREQVINDMVSVDDVSLVLKLMTPGLTEKRSEDIVSVLTERDVSDDYSAASRFASLIRLMTSSMGGNPAPYKAAYVFFDEVEDMLNLRYADLFLFWSALRELINRTAGNRCAIFLAFTVAAAADLDAQIEPFLTERLTRPYIPMKQLDDEAAKGFIKEYLHSIRLRGEKVKQPFFPFSEDAVSYLVERNQEIVPRKLLKDMLVVFNRATKRGKVSSGEEISRDVAEEILTEIYSHE